MTRGSVAGDSTRRERGRLGRREAAAALGASVRATATSIAMGFTLLMVSADGRYNAPGEDTFGSDEWGAHASPGFSFATGVGSREGGVRKESCWGRCLWGEVRLRGRFHGGPSRDWGTVAALGSQGDRGWPRVECEIRVHWPEVARRFRYSGSGRLGQGLSGSDGHGWGIGGRRPGLEGGGYWDGSCHRRRVFARDLAWNCCMGWSICNGWQRSLRDGLRRGNQRRSGQVSEAGEGELATVRGKVT